MINDSERISFFMMKLSNFQVPCYVARGVHPATESDNELSIPQPHEFVPNQNACRCGVEGAEDL